MMRQEEQKNQELINKVDEDIDREEYTKEVNEKIFENIQEETELIKEKLRDI